MRPWKVIRMLFGVLALFTSASEMRVVQGGFAYEIDLTGFETFGDFTNPNNSWVEIELFPNARIVQAEWLDLEFTTENGSFISEFTISLNDSANLGAGPTFWDMQPAASINEPGTYRGSGTFSEPAAFGSGPFSLLPDGFLRVYVHELFADTGPDGEEIRNAFVTRGTVRITAVPEPSSLLYIASSLGIWFTVRHRSKNRQLPLVARGHQWDA